MKILPAVFLGLVLFLLGLKLMSLGLEALWSTPFAAAIQRYTGNRITAFLCGFIFTALTQSSSLATVLVVGIVDAGLMPLGAAISVIIGANVGTTITGQLISFQLNQYAVPLVAIGLFIFIIGKGKLQQGGKALIGLGVLLFGLKTMGEALTPIGTTAWFNKLVQIAGIHPFWGITAGALLTAVIQSSSAVIGVTIAMAQKGMIDLAGGIAVMLGADVGTCVTALLAGFSSSFTARQAAAAHLFFNLLTLCLVLPVYPFYVRLIAASAALIPRQLANAHTLYNLGGAIMILLFLTPFQRMVEGLIKPDYSSKRRILLLFSEVIRKWF
ncbi:MAG: Na/Pi cotransporter family protein [Firmicutes bacterium]|nr:Na/Pi cotransporter family protein [Bacillota bacterium]